MTDWSSSIVAPSDAVRSARHCSILVVFTRGDGFALATLAGDMADLPWVSFLSEAEILLFFVAFAVFAVVVVDFDVFFMGWNSVVLNTALSAAFAPPQAPRMARRCRRLRPSPLGSFS